MGIDGDEEIGNKALQIGAHYFKRSKEFGFLLFVSSGESYLKTISLSPPISPSPFLHMRSFRISDSQLPDPSLHGRSSRDMLRPRQITRF